MNAIFRIITSAFLAFSGTILFAKDGELEPKAIDLNQVDLEQLDDNWDNASSVPRVNPDSGMKIKDIVEPTSEYSYASFGKTDPFSMPSSLFGGTGSGSVNAPNGPADGQNPDGTPGFGSKDITITSPLQAYPITALNIRGVWQLADGEFRAVIQTPKKEGVVIKAGDPISSGKVLSIEKESILVRLYRLRKDGVREYDDSRLTFGAGGSKMAIESIRLEPGKEAQFPGMDAPADTKGAIDAPGAAKAGLPVKAAPAGFKNPDLIPESGAPQGAALPAAAAGVATPPPPPVPTPAKSAPASGRPGSNVK